MTERPQSRPVNHLVFALVAGSSFAVLVLELVAGRLLAPAIGVSLYTWTTIIGVVLGSLAVGNDVGGRIARRHAPGPALEATLLASGAYTVAIAALSQMFTIDDLAIGLPTFVRLFLFVGAFGIVPCVLLGTTTPLVAHSVIAIQGRDDAGPIVGRLSAVATVGSLVGAFGTGFLFVPQFGTRTTLAMVAILLAVLGAIANPDAHRRTRPIIIAGVIVAVAIWIATTTFTAHAEVVIAADTHRQALPQRPLPTGCLVESPYTCIRLTWSTNGVFDFGIIRLDRSVQGQTAPDAPRLLSSAIAQAFGDILATANDPPAGAVTLPPLRVLFIGGGSYTLPRWVEAVAPGSTVHVIELDPHVTGVATRWLGVRLINDTDATSFPRGAGISAVHDDARRVIRTLASGQYDVVIGDAFADMAVPWHLTTVEFTRDVRRVLRPGGRYAVNVIDGWPGGQFLPAYMRTLTTVFPEADVLSTATPGLVKYDVVQNWVATASDTQIDGARFAHATRPGINRQGQAVALPTYARLVARDHTTPTDDTDPDAPAWWPVAQTFPPLTDDRAPVDWYLARRLAE